jgi:hypothetical protein
MGFPAIVKCDGKCHAKDDEKDQCRMLTYDGEIGMHCNVFAPAIPIKGYKSLEVCNRVYGITYEDVV